MITDETRAINERSRSTGAPFEAGSGTLERLVTLKETVVPPLIDCGTWLMVGGLGLFSVSGTRWAKE